MKPSVRAALMVACIEYGFTCQMHGIATVTGQNLEASSKQRDQAFQRVLDIVHEGEEG